MKRSMSLLIVVFSIILMVTSCVSFDEEAFFFNPFSSTDDEEEYYDYDDGGESNYVEYEEKKTIPQIGNRSIRPNPETDFQVTINDDFTGAVVTGYNGVSKRVYVPATIQGLPVKEVRLRNIDSLTLIIISEGCEYVSLGVRGSVDGIGREQRYSITKSMANHPAVLFQNQSQNQSQEKPSLVVSLPDSVTFLDLESNAITELEIPAGVKVVNILPPSLEKVSFRGVPEEIGKSAFAYTKISSIVIPEGVKKIGSYAFNGELEFVVLPSSIEEIPYRAFRGASLKEVTIPEGVKKIGGEAFIGCKELESVTLPSSIKEIGSRAFNGCSNLKEIIIPESVYAIRFPQAQYTNDSSIDCFRGCNLSLASQTMLRHLGYEGSF